MKETDTSTFKGDGGHWATMVILTNSMLSADVWMDEEDCGILRLYDSRWSYTRPFIYCCAQSIMGN